MKLTTLLGALLVICLGSLASAQSVIDDALRKTAEEVFATEMYVDLDGMLRSDTTMPLTSPSLSPDCQLLAYMDPTRGSGDICLLNLKDKTTTVLVGTPAYENEPRFSHRGDKVYFFRPDEVGRHIFAIDLKSRQEVQITRGEVIDELFDIAEDDASLIVHRDPAHRGNSAIRTGFYEIDLSREPPKENFIGKFPHHTPSGRYLAYSALEEKEEERSVWVQDRRTGDRRRIGKGSLFGMHASRDAILVSHSPQKFTLDGPDHPLAVIDVESRKEQAVGKGHNAIFLSDNLVFFSQGYQNDCFVHNLATSTTSDLKMPTGYLHVPILHKKCGKATVCIQVPNGEKVWSFGMLDVDSLKYEEVLRIDTNKIRATKADKVRALERSDR